MGRVTFVGSIAIALASVLLLVRHPVAHAVAGVPAPPSTPVPAHIRYVPPPSKRPAPVLIALHGMGDRGAAFSATMLARAQAEGWVLVAPTIQYGDWRNPTAVAAEDTALVERIRTWVEQLPQDTGINVEPKVMMYGFSRGAQLAHRFTLVHPELVRTAVVLSAGTYTLPFESVQVNGAMAKLIWPYGCSDFATRFGRKLNPEALKGVPFLVGVGELDNNPSDLPRQWDDYEGNNRVARARAFANALSSMGVPTRFMVFPRRGHQPEGIQRMASLDYLNSVIYHEDELNPPYDRPIRAEASVRMAEMNLAY